MTSVDMGMVTQILQETGDVSNQFGASRPLPVIRNDIRLSQSFAAGKPIRYYAPKSRAAEDFAQLGALICRFA